MHQRLPIVGVMGSSTQDWSGLAVPLGRALAARDVHLLTGGGANVMTDVTRAFTQVENRKGLAIGILPTEAQPDGTFRLKSGFPNPFVEIPIATPLDVFSGDDMAVVSRNHVNILTADFIIALPGSGGTRNEINLCVKFGKPLCLLGPHDRSIHDHPDLPYVNDVDAALAWLDTHLKERKP